MVIKIAISKSQNQNPATRTTETQAECETESELDHENGSNADIKLVKKTPLYPQERLRQKVTNFKYSLFIFSDGNRTMFKKL